VNLTNVATPWRMRKRKRTAGWMTERESGNDIASGRQTPAGREKEKAACAASLRTPGRCLALPKAWQ
jgi:hypothetical protein